ncbi:hypothetical protein GLOTRDRAFT_137034 [Gloeophyllum trabeum ATCC 11539]|uniref:Carbohydrate-binding module family 19 domain-containing protein n=1 Tax=Gloeophyllum trabeum (strain ATCC 11539 / FP-39264 / Madison 617) TaxID=670483 RepID=S7QEP2_GLOTA|nr:uncharacterized protein GLOTRDRAFT_137034 [Gloeophyllum trabeum ATCC 11539]EPQ58291.1 hypothetical protein GLOTRDRAFT_137034 [Gloeophyllum trabeum ATCC 11539]
MRAFSVVLLPLSAALLASAGPVDRRAAFTLANGQAAQNLNAHFATLTPDSPCTDGQNACINGQFAQCAGGKFAITGCAGGLQCVALPLVNSPGTSVTCDTAADAAARIAATGATGGLTGRSLPESSIEKRAAFTLANGQAAQALNAKFATLAPDSSCTPGENACVNGQFAQCANGNFVTFPCAGGLQCVALPLVNSAGTSITCDTTADAVTRIAATGASGGLTGRSLEARQATAPPACAAKAKRSTDMELVRRIAQSDLPAVAQSWQDLCLKSGGDITTNSPCVTLAGVNGINALLANSDPCAQQDNADAMIDFAKSAGVTNQDALIANAIAFRKHPRNALNINGVVPSTPFCTRAPRNPELQGVVNAQLDGVNPGLFGSPALGVFAFGAAGTCPFGQTPDVATCTCN